MTCRLYTDAIQELVDGTLGPIRRAELQTHLDVCDDCRALVGDLQKIRTSAASLDPVQPPPHVWLQIANQLRQEGVAVNVPQSPRRHVAMLAIAATLMLSVGAALYLLLPGRPAAPAVNAPQTAAAGRETTTGNAGATDPVQ